ncbi:MAG TPA: hypothetical protein VNW29_02505 [Candidatus Sulfotelmatobacter sp.]|jgi:hypothetical protein|nr:hypothetical protein [Candidatus Sulfotelmatobacter sp.]
MRKRNGVILLDESEIIFRIYETTNHEWKLFHYYSSLLPPPTLVQINDILEIIGDFFTTEYAQHIAEWKICSRHYPIQLVNNLSHALAITIEDINLHREQELLCKGMFTELW